MRISTAFVLMLNVLLFFLVGSSKSRQLIISTKATTWKMGARWAHAKDTNKQALAPALKWYSNGGPGVVVGGRLLAPQDGPFMTSSYVRRLPDSAEGMLASWWISLRAHRGAINWILQPHKRRTCPRRIISGSLPPFLYWILKLRDRNQVFQFCGCKRGIYWSH